MKDVFRKDNFPLTSGQIESVKHIKEKAQEFHDFIDLCCSQHPQIDERALALSATNLEQSIMWAIKAITTPIKFVKDCL